jgi:hypothetical protein
MVDARHLFSESIEVGADVLGELDFLVLVRVVAVVALALGVRRVTVIVPQDRGVVGTEVLKPVFVSARVQLWVRPLAVDDHSAPVGQLDFVVDQHRRIIATVFGPHRSTFSLQPKLGVAVI